MSTLFFDTTTAAYTPPDNDVAGLDRASHFTFGDEAYTRCAEHGVQDIGTLRRDVAKVVRR